MVVQSGLHTECELEPEEGEEHRNVDVNFSAKTVRTQPGRVIGFGYASCAVILQFVK